MPRPTTHSHFDHFDYWQAHIRAQGLPAETEHDATESILHLYRVHQSLQKVADVLRVSKFAARSHISGRVAMRRAGGPNNRTRVVTYQGRSLLLKEWLSRLGLPSDYQHYQIYAARIFNCGWTPEEAFSRPIKRKRR